MKKGYVKDFQVLLPKMDEVVKETYTDNEIMLLLKKPDMKKSDFPEYRNWVIVNYMLGTGNRAGTILNIKIEDLDFESGNIILKKLKGRKQYYIPISKSLAQILREYVIYRKGETSDFLFCTAYGKPLTLNGLETEIAKYNKIRGVEKTSLHKFRHTFAKQWILNGGDIFRLQKILGHSSLDMVRKYVNMFSDDLRRDFDSFNPLDNYLGNAGNNEKIRLKK
jgi:integrase/recombinase XerD